MKSLPQILRFVIKEQLWSSEYLLDSSLSKDKLLEITDLGGQRYNELNFISFLFKSFWL